MYTTQIINNAVSIDNTPTDCRYTDDTVLRGTSQTAYSIVTIPYWIPSACKHYF